MAVVCMDDLEITKACQSSDFQYYCTPRGELERNGAFVHKVCQEECRCADLRPKPKCVFWVNGMSSCLRTREEVKDLPESLVLPITSLPSPTQLSTSGRGPIANYSAAERHDQSLSEEDTSLPERTDEQVIDHGTGDLQGRSIQWYENPYDNHALVCADNRGFTYKCQSRHGYFCTKDGLLAHRPKTGKADEDCLDFCECLNLYPKPSCIPGITEIIYCLRDGDSWVLESSSTTQPALAASNTERPLSTPAESMGIVVKGSSDADSNELKRRDTIVETSSATQPALSATTTDKSTAAVVGSVTSRCLDSGELQPRAPHDYAMVCGSSQSATRGCQSAGGYYCSSEGELWRDIDKSKFQIHNCEIICKWINLNPKPNCIPGLTGITYCLRDISDGEQERELVTAALFEPDADDV